MTQKEEQEAIDDLVTGEYGYFRIRRIDGMTINSTGICRLVLHPGVGGMRRLLLISCKRAETWAIGDSLRIERSTEPLPDEPEVARFLHITRVAG